MTPVVGYTPHATRGRSRENHGAFFIAHISPLPRQVALPAFMQGFFIQKNPAGLRLRDERKLSKQKITTD